MFYLKWAYVEAANLISIQRGALARAACRAVIRAGETSHENAW